MTIIREFNSFKSNLLKLRNYVNKSCLYNQENEVKLIIFNSIINNYPDNNWFNIKNNFFQNLPKEDIIETIIYTILSYKLGNNFVSLPEVIQKDLIDTLIINEVSTYNLVKHSNILINSEILEQTIYGYDNHLIKPRYVYKIIYDNFDLNYIDDKKLERMYSLIDKFISEHEIKLFNGNYYFFNIYTCLKKLITLEVYQEDTSIIELIPLFNTIPNEQLKEMIQKDFLRLEESNKPLIEKIEDAITITHNYSYDLPLAQKTREK